MSVRNNFKRAVLLVFCLSVSASFGHADKHRSVNLSLVEGYDRPDALDLTFLNGSGKTTSIEFKSLACDSRETYFPGSLTLAAQSSMGIKVQIPFEVLPVWEKLE